MAEELTHREEALRSANRRLSSLASLDPLTGIANRRSFDAVFAVQWSTARHLGVLMIDIDDFKLYNDHYGHMDGDRCLHRIAQALAGAVAGTDVIARIGGEEFAVLLPGATLASAAELAERLRLAVEELGIDHAPSLRGPVTVSIGCATCAPAPGLYGGDLMLAADQALYAAKQAGRNRVRLGGSVRPAGQGPGTASATAGRGAAGG
nr:GGDEF domain-containing protein [Ancylobacter sp. Lp-2]